MTPETAAKPAPKPKPTGYHWALNFPRMTCYSGGTGQVVLGLWEAEEPSVAHDETLMQVTKEINKILAEVAKEPPEPGLELSMIQFEGAQMLAWTEPVRGLTAANSLEEIAEALHIRL
jgi:hypothetical protein